MGIVEQVAVGLLPALIGLAAGRAWERALALHKFAHIRALLNHRGRAQIIVSSVEISRFRPVGSDDALGPVQVPRNVLYMPMPEGRAIAELIEALHRVQPKLRIRLVTAENYDPEILTFSIGGPSVNKFSARILNADFPDFNIYYPATKRARYGGHVFETRYDADGRLTRDYGFVFVTRTSRNAPCIIFCGVRAFGTAMAVELFHTIPHRSDAARLIRKSTRAFLAADGEVDGLVENSVKLCFSLELLLR